MNKLYNIGDLVGYHFKADRILRHIAITSQKLGVVVEVKERPDMGQPIYRVQWVNGSENWYEPQHLTSVDKAEPQGRDIITPFNNNKEKGEL